MSAALVFAVVLLAVVLLELVALAVVYARCVAASRADVVERIIRELDLRARRA